MGFFSNDGARTGLFFHVAIAVVVVVASHFIGVWLNAAFA